MIACHSRDDTIPSTYTPPSLVHTSTHTVTVYAIELMNILLLQPSVTEAGREEPFFAAEEVSLFPWQQLMQYIVLLDAHWINNTGYTVYKGWIDC